MKRIPNNMNQTGESHQLSDIYETAIAKRQLQAIAKIVDYLQFVDSLKKISDRLINIDCHS